MKVQRGTLQAEVIRERGRVVAEATRRLQLHTETYPHNTEAGKALDKRIIVEEASTIINHLTALLALLARE